MSIKTIDNESVSNESGVAKKIHKGAEKMVFDILQSTQYSNPIPSTIRELTTNACDSQREKEIAIEILTGVKNSEDYYITRDGEQYKDSNFDENYYDLKFLNQSCNNIQITYKQNPGLGYCDEVIIKDCGVGLREDRLEGILQLGFSTKRNTSENFGAFGLGAKVALSTGVDFYSIETVHNGKKFKCDCYPYSTKFKYPSFNPYVIFKDGSKVHYEKVDTFNYTTISFKVKKHNRNRYVQAVEEQLTYLGNVEFSVITESGYEDKKYFHSTILHNSNTLIVADSYIHSIPHIVIVKNVESNTGINYGAIDFRELEMERLWGSVGLKCPVRQVIKDEFGKETVLLEGVDVTPSREKVIWNEKTKAFIQDLLSKAILEAEVIVETALDEDDLIKWITKCKSVLSLSSSADIEENDSIALTQLSRITDMSSVKPKFKPEPKINYLSPAELFKGFVINGIARQAYLEGSPLFKGSSILRWKEIDTTNTFYFQEEGNRSPIKDYYIIHDTDEDYYIHLKPKSTASLETQIESLPAHSEKLPKLRKQLKEIKDSYNTILPFLKASEQYSDYSEIIIPDGFEDTFKNFKNKEELAIQTATLTPKERREQQKLILVHACLEDNKYRNEGPIWKKVSVSIETLSNPSSPVYYGVAEDASKLILAFSIVKHQRTGKSFSFERYSDSPFYNNHISYIDALPDNIRYATKNKNANTNEVPQFIKVSKVVARTIKSKTTCKDISDFFLEVTEDGEYTIPDSLKIWWNTRKKKMTPSWVRLYKHLDPKYREFFNTINMYESYISNNCHNSRNGFLIDLYQKLEMFEMYVISVQNLEDSELKIATKSAELFVLSDIKGAKIIDFEIQNIFEVRDSLITGIDNFFGELNLMGDCESPEFLTELKLYLQIHGKLDIELPQLPLTQ